VCAKEKIGGRARLSGEGCIGEQAETGKTKVPSLPGLAQGVIPLTSLERTVVEGNEKKYVTRKQVPLTLHTRSQIIAQGQTIDKAIIDIESPPSGRITPINIYVTLSRCRGRSSVRLLRDFDEKLVTTHPSEFLRLQDTRLETLDRHTEQWGKENEESML